MSIFKEFTIYVHLYQIANFILICP